MAVARAKGRLRGKSPKLNPRREAHLVALHAAGEHTTGELAELFGVGRATVYRALDRARPGRHVDLIALVAGNAGLLAVPAGRSFAMEGASRGRAG
jgi:hypothetical protein